MLERFNYLSLRGQVGDQTFGFERYMNQRFYRSREWRDIRNHVIVRDNGFDLGCKGFLIAGSASIHHMNPVTPENIKQHDESILDPEFLISVSHQTHNAVHYGSAKSLPRVYTPRRPGDTKLW